MNKHINDVIKDALNKLEPLFEGFYCYKLDHPKEATLLLSQHGYNFDDDEKWRYAPENNFPPEAFLKDIYDFCVKHGEDDTNGVVFTKGYVIKGDAPESAKLTRVSASDVYTLIENYVRARSEANL